MTNVYKPLPIESVERAQVMLRLQILRIFHRVEASQLGRRILYLCTHFVPLGFYLKTVFKIYLVTSRVDIFYLLRLFSG